MSFDAILAEIVDGCSDCVGIVLMGSDTGAHQHDDGLRGRIAVVLEEAISATGQLSKAFHRR